MSYEAVEMVQQPRSSGMWCSPAVLLLPEICSKENVKPSWHANQSTDVAFQAVIDYNEMGRKHAINVNSFEFSLPDAASFQRAVGGCSAV